MTIEVESQTLRKDCYKGNRVPLPTPGAVEKTLVWAGHATLKNRLLNGVGQVSNYMFPDTITVYISYARSEI